MSEEMKAHPPELKTFMDKELSLKLNAGRHVQGIVWGSEPFLNLVIDECVEMASGGPHSNIGMVVPSCYKPWSEYKQWRVHQKKPAASTCPLSIAPHW
uniref:Sm protein G n=1 Tax=Suricata suricatta TaxID=37032 RepID=A0A673VHC4_SURSU